MPALQSKAACLCLPARGRTARADPAGLSTAAGRRGVKARHAHLDTWAIMEVLIGGTYADVLEEIMRRSGAGSYSLVVSQAALGEADAVILRRGPGAARMLLALLALLADHRVDPGRCMPPVDAAVLSIVNELAAVAPELDMTDRIILAHALADPCSVFFITGDRSLLENKAIARYEAWLRKQGRRCEELAIIRPVEASRVS